MDTKFKYFEQADVVNSPTHYNFKGIEAIDAIEAGMTAEEFTGYLKGNCMKYLYDTSTGQACGRPEKCQWYLNKLIASVEKL